MLQHLLIVTFRSFEKIKGYLFIPYEGPESFQGNCPDFYATQKHLSQHDISVISYVYLRKSIAPSHISSMTDQLIVIQIYLNLNKQRFVQCYHAASLNTRESSRFSFYSTTVWQHSCAIIICFPNFFSMKFFFP